jgi:acetyl-CoA acetyltransferase
MTMAYLVGGVRTPIGRYAGALSAVRTDDLAAHPIRALLARYPQVPADAVDEVVLGCANQALTAAVELSLRGAGRALATMCIGVGQGISVLLEPP